MRLERYRPQTAVHVLDESGVHKTNVGDARRSANLDRQVGIFSERDDTKLHLETALRAVIEFDTVFLADAADGEMHDFRSAG